VVSCYGGAAESAATRTLRAGSVFVAPAPGEQVVAGGDVKEFFQRLSTRLVLKGNFSADNILNEYLVADLTDRIPPRITIVGQASYDLENMFRARSGTAFTKEEKERIHVQLGKYFDEKKIDAVITKIETARSEYDISAKDFGTALAITFAANGTLKSAIDPERRGRLLRLR
jgi:hypothetical protein